MVINHVLTGTILQVLATYHEKSIHEHFTKKRVQSIKERFLENFQEQVRNNKMGKYRYKKSWKRSTKKKLSKKY